MVIQAISVIGALMVLIAYGLIQSGIWRELDAGYLVLNILGSLLLGAVAVIEHQVGFVLLEFAWAGLGFWGVMRALKARRESPVS
jgi:fluoride ion exporter CrcB/FEX